MTQHTVKGAWFDKSGRRHNVQFQADTTDRGTLKDMIRAQYPCDDTKAGNGVIINAVMADQVAAANRRREFEERQSNGYSTSGSDSNQGGFAGNITGQNLVSSGSADDGNGIIALIIIVSILGAIGWAIGTFGGFLTGPVAALGAYKGLKKVTGKDRYDYEEVATGQSKSVGSILCLILILSSGIVGARWGHQFSTEYNAETSVEQVAE